MRFSKISALLALGVGALSACSGSGSSAPSAINVSGNYAGSASDSVSGNVQLSISLSESGNVLTGNLNETTSSGTIVATGTISGTLSGKTISGNVTSTSTTGCPLTIAATTTSDGNTLSGSYAATGCMTADTGTFSVTR